MNFLSKRGRHWAAMVAGVTAVAGQVRAFDATDLLAFQTGPLTLKPHVAVQGQYNDNIFYQPGPLHPAADFITTLNPGLTVSLGHEEVKSAVVEPAVNYTPLGVVTEEEPNFISADYALASHFYAQHSSLDTLEHLVTIRDRLKGQRLRLDGSDSIQFLAGIIGQGYNLGNAVVHRTVFSDNYRLSYAVSEKTSTYGVMSYSASDYAPGTPLYSINTLQGTLGFSARLLPKSSFFGEVYYGQTGVRPATPNTPGFPDGPHADVEGAFLGILGKFTEKLTGSVKVGYEVTSFGHSASGMSAPVVEAALNQRFSQKALLMLTYTRHGYVSVQGVGVGYVSDQAAVNWIQVLGETGRVTALLGVGYQTFEFQSTGFFAHRHDDWFRAGASVNYKFNLWMTGSLAYEFEKFNSNFLPSIIDYNANRVTLKLLVGY